MSAGNSCHFKLIANWQLEIRSRFCPCLSEIKDPLYKCCTWNESLTGVATITIIIMVRYIKEKKEKTNRKHSYFWCWYHGKLSTCLLTLFLKIFLHVVFSKTLSTLWFGEWSSWNKPFYSGQKCLIMW